jgi:hypothetical protein
MERPMPPLRHQRPVGGDTELPIGVGHLAAHTSSVATCAASTVSKRPTVVMGERPGGSSTGRARVDQGSSVKGGA